MRDERELLALAAIAQKKIPILRFVDTDAAPRCRRIETYGYIALKKRRGQTVPQ